jgi:hypothetical protein
MWRGILSNNSFAVRRIRIVLTGEKMMKKLPVLLIAASLLITLLAGCVVAAPEPDRSVDPGEGALPTQEQGTGQTGGGQIDSDIASTAIIVAAERLGVVAAAVELLSVSQVEWPSPALGCPVPGDTYAQVITPGYQVVVKVNDVAYSVNTDMQGNLVVCSPDGGPVLTQQIQPTEPVEETQ